MLGPMWFRILTVNYIEKRLHQKCAIGDSNQIEMKCIHSRIGIGPKPPTVSRSLVRTSSITQLRINSVLLVGSGVGVGPPARAATISGQHTGGRHQWPCAPLSWRPLVRSSTLDSHLSTRSSTLDSLVTCPPFAHTSPGDSTAARQLHPRDHPRSQLPRD